jgi:hypothetical protein
MQQVRLHHQWQLADIFQEKNSSMAEFQLHATRKWSRKTSARWIRKVRLLHLAEPYPYNLRCGNDSLGVASIRAANVLWFFAGPASSMISTGTFTCYIAD